MHACVCVHVQPTCFYLKFHAEKAHMSTYTIIQAFYDKSQKQP